MRHRQDRFFAVQLYQRRIPLAVVENALVLGAARRLYRDLLAPPLAPVLSLHYFSALSEEVLSLKINPTYFQYCTIGQRILPFGGFAIVFHLRWRPLAHVDEGVAFQMGGFDFAVVSH